MPVSLLWQYDFCHLFCIRPQTRILSKEKCKDCFYQGPYPHLLCFCTQCTLCLQPDLSIEKKDDILSDWLPKHFNTSKNMIKENWTRYSTLGEVPRVSGYNLCFLVISREGLIQHCQFFPVHMEGYSTKTCPREIFRFSDNILGWVSQYQLRFGGAWTQYFLHLSGKLIQFSLTWYFEENWYNFLLTWYLEAFSKLVSPFQDFSFSLQNYITQYLTFGTKYFFESRTVLIRGSWNISIR